MFPERVAADAGRVSLPEASKSFDRAKTTAEIPQMGTVLATATTSGGHVDVVTRACVNSLPINAASLPTAATSWRWRRHNCSRDEFARIVRTEVRRIQTDDGIDRLQQQRRNTRLRTWLDRDTGMWCLRGEFDPETGALFEGRLRNTIESLFHDHQPDTCPTDPSGEAAPSCGRWRWSR